MIDVEANLPLYKRRCEPHADLAAANEAWADFASAVYRLMEVHGIADATIVSAQHYFDDDGKEVIGQADTHFGHAALKLPMLAMAYGDARKRFLDNVDKMASGK